MDQMFADKIIKGLTWYAVYKIEHDLNFTMPREEVQEILDSTLKNEEDCLKFGELFLKAFTEAGLKIEEA